jgi:hypothetical protein
VRGVEDRLEPTFEFPRIEVLTECLIAFVAQTSNLGNGGAGIIRLEAPGDSRVTDPKPALRLPEGP